MSIKYTMPKDAAGLDKLIVQVGEHYQTARRRAQVAAVAVLIHAAKHGDYSHADKLVEAVGNGGNQKAMIEFLIEFGGLTVGDNGFTGWQGKQYIKDKLDAAKAKMWWTFAKKNPYQGFDLTAQVAALISQANGAIAKRNKAEAEGDTETAEKIKVDSAELQELIALKARLSGSTMTGNKPASIQ